MIKNWKETEAATIEALRDPCPGDEFHEMFSFWILVLDVTSTRVFWVEVCGTRKDFRAGTRTEFYQHFIFVKKPWVDLNRRGIDVTGLADEYWPLVLNRDALPLCEAVVGIETMEADPR